MKSVAPKLLEKNGQSLVQMFSFICVFLTGDMYIRSVIIIKKFTELTWFQ